jgi:hypothetical protein
VRPLAVPHPCAATLQPHVLPERHVERSIALPANPTHHPERRPKRALWIP